MQRKLLRERTVAHGGAVPRPVQKEIRLHPHHTFHHPLQGGLAVSQKLDHLVGLLVIVLDIGTVRRGKLAAADQRLIRAVDRDPRQIIIVHDAAQLSVIFHNIKIRNDILGRHLAALTIERFGVERADALARAHHLRLGHLQRPGDAAVLLFCHFGQISVHDAQRSRIRRRLADELQAQAFLQIGRAHAGGLHALHQHDALAHRLNRNTEDLRGGFRGFGEEAVFVQRMDQILHDPLLCTGQLEPGALQQQLVHGGRAGRLVFDQLLLGQAPVRGYGAAALKRAGPVFDLREFQLDHGVAGHQLAEIAAQLQVVQLQQPHRGLHGKGHALPLAEFQIHGAASPLLGNGEIAAPPEARRPVCCDFTTPCKKLQSCKKVGILGNNL